MEQYRFNSHIRDLYFFCIRTIWAKQDATIDINPPYQRGSVWSAEQNYGLIRSILMGIPIPAITVAERSKVRGGDFVDQPYHYAIIDGKQRLTTMLSYVNGSFALPRGYIPSKYLPETYKEAYFISELAGYGAQHHINNYALPVNSIRTTTLKQEAEIYLLLNQTHVSHTTSDFEVAQAILNG